MTDSSVAGLLLAAGAGTRMGMPKALLADDRGTPLLVLGAERLLSAGCSSVTVVLGAEARAVSHFLEMFQPGTHLVGHLDVVVAQEWAEGLSASLGRGLAALESNTSAAVLISLVDLPDVGAAVMERVIQHWRDAGAPSTGLVRATYAGQPGHPVLIGREHWAQLRQSLTGDRGAQAYLSVRRVHQVPCEDLATGRDVDRPGDLRLGTT